MIARLRHITVRQWMILALSNLLLVAALGMLMRLKMLLPLPAINQKFLLHAHSHFAFSGWVSHALMVLMAAVIANRKSHENLSLKYQVFLVANLLASYGMLVGFFFQGYGPFSIFTSSVSVVISYGFAVLSWRDMTKADRKSSGYRWFRAALVFLVLSSIGTFFLAYLMASNNTDSRLQLASVYFYLHFQYNGWFFFACMGLIQHWLIQKKVTLTHTRMVYWLFAWTCPVTYLLSILWWDMPGWLYAIAVAAVVGQGTAWIAWIRAWAIKLPLFRHHIPMVSKWLFLGVVTAATIKFTLQGLSVIPSLSQLSYGFRPIVIGYLHLVLLVIISLFIIAYAYLNRSLTSNRPAFVSTFILVAGIVLNELLLMAQGIAGLTYVYIKHIPLLLAFAAAIILIGLTGLLWSQRSE
ncbi:hypothetical protein GCM10007415_17080 [Parapedobacter pyrenivorans]|uniref:Uncharacterized protein n=1 Tax=Parapedobacter pyrenivorans TaxID=1305674 RepID=A0A917HN05_9SPHI|nr:hypothetical protein [Parapedobacter pyrenivorans]GGG84497.1 hypothetical protein GCM10007415_17080 [Parapedobacter pyrenivorans]